MFSENYLRLLVEQKSLGYTWSSGGTGNLVNLYNIYYIEQLIQILHFLLAKFLMNIDYSFFLVC